MRSSAAHGGQSRSTRSRTTCSAKRTSPIYEPAARYALREGMELALLAAIQLLPGRQRAVLILRDVLGWTGPEVAEMLETTVASVNSALQRARATVDSALPERAYAPAEPVERELLDRYVEVWSAGDFDGLVELLREDAESCACRRAPRSEARSDRVLLARDGGAAATCADAAAR